MFKFPKTISIEASENFINSISNNKNEPLILTLETTGTAQSFGGLASAIQAINTWGRVSEKKEIRFKSNSTEQVINEIIERPHKFAASMNAKSIIVSDEKDTEILQLVYEKAKLAIEEQAKQQHGQKKGALCYFTFVDHSTKGFDPNFYNLMNGFSPEVKHPDQIKTVIDNMTRTALLPLGGNFTDNTSILSALGRIFYELFLNTHEHGSRDKDRTKWIRPGLRTLYVQGINLSNRAAENGSKEQPAISKYVNSIDSKNSQDTQKRFIEIGIIDSGLGYFERWQSDRNSEYLSNDESRPSEYEIFKKCFNFRQTSTLLKDAKGNGLPAVLDRLTKLKGFIRIRSGHLSLYRDLIEQPFKVDDDCTFNDWNTTKNASSEITKMAKVSGVALTLLIPLEKDNA